MSVWRPKYAGLLLTALILLLVSGCVETGRARTRSRSVVLGDAQTVEVRVEMAAGELMISGGANTLMDAEFRYNVASWEPQVDYRILNDEGILEIRQPRAIRLPWPVEYLYNWNIRLDNDVPLTMEVRLGAGEAMLDLAGMSLTELGFDVGAGSGSLDLTGDWDNDLDVSVQGGVGELTVRLPAEVGARVEVEGGVGNVNARGLRIDGDTYFNDAYGESDVQVDVEIRGAVGQVNLAVAD